MSKFVSPEPDENAFVHDAEVLVAQRSLLSLPFYGICAVGGNEVVDQPDFAANGIDGSEAVNVNIRIVPPPDNPTSASVAGFGGYINVGRTIKELGEAPSVRQGVIAMIENENNQIGVVYHPGEVEAKVNNTPGVWDAADVAFEEAWVKAGKNA